MRDDIYCQWIPSKSLRIGHLECIRLWYRVIIRHFLSIITMRKACFLLFSMYNYVMPRQLISIIDINASKLIWRPFWAKQVIQESLCVTILSSSCSSVGSRKKEMPLQIPNRQLLKRLERTGKVNAFRRRQVTRAYSPGAYHPFGGGGMILLSNTNPFYMNFSGRKIPLLQLS